MNILLKILEILNGIRTWGVLVYNSPTVFKLRMFMIHLAYFWLACSPEKDRNPDEAESTQYVVSSGQPKPVKVDGSPVPLAPVDFGSPSSFPVEIVAKKKACGVDSEDAIFYSVGERTFYTCLGGASEEIANDYFWTVLAGYGQVRQARPLSHLFDANGVDLGVAAFLRLPGGALKDGFLIMRDLTTVRLSLGSGEFRESLATTAKGDEFTSDNFCFFKNKDCLGSCFAVGRKPFKPVTGSLYFSGRAWFVVDGGESPSDGGSYQSAHSGLVGGCQNIGSFSYPHGFAVTTQYPASAKFGSLVPRAPLSVGPKND